MRTNKLLIFSIVVMSLVFVTCSRFLTCSNEEVKKEEPKEILSKDKTISKVALNTSPKVTATVDVAKKNITATVPFGTDLTKVTLAITHSGVSISPLPETAQDFSNGKSVTYTVKAEDGSTQDYAVSITVKEQTQFTVSFNTDGGNTIASTKIKKGEKATTPDEPSKAGSIFKEWQLDDKTFDFNTPIIKDITLKAIWIEPLNITSADWKTKNINGGVQILTYTGTDTEVVIPTTIDGKKVLAIEKSSIGFINIFNGSILPIAAPTTNITSIDFTKAIYLTFIGDHAFADCTSLTSIIIPDSVTSIGDYGFNRSIRLASITIPDSVTSIGFAAFRWCASLTSINLPKALTSIETSTFGHCTSLTSIKIPESVTSIESSAFRECTHLTSIRLPESLTSIGFGAFFNCTSLTSIKIPDAVTSIEATAFSDCTNLVEVTLSNTLTSIGISTFANCTSLTSITIPESVTSIGTQAFLNNKITKVTLPTNCTYKANSFDDAVAVSGGKEQ